MMLLTKSSAQQSERTASMTVAAKTTPSINNNIYAITKEPAASPLVLHTNNTPPSNSCSPPHSFRPSNSSISQQESVGKNGKEQSKRKDTTSSPSLSSSPLGEETINNKALAVLLKDSCDYSDNNSKSDINKLVPPLDLTIIEKKKKRKRKKTASPKTLAIINPEEDNKLVGTAAIMSSYNNNNNNLKEASPILAIETKSSNQLLVNNNNLTTPIKNNLTTFVMQQQQHQPVLRSGSVSSGLDAEDDVNNNEQQYESPASTPRMFSPSSTLNFNAVSPREFPLDSPQQLPGQYKQQLPPVVNNAIVANVVQSSNAAVHNDDAQPPHSSPNSNLHHHDHHQISEHETAVDLTSVETHDSEHVHSSKTVALSTSSSVNNSSPAFGKHHSVRSRSNSTKSAQFNRPLERSLTAPDIITKKQPEKQHSKSSSRFSTKYGQSEYKTFVKHTLKLKEVGDMRVRGISLKYETNYHEFLEEAIPHKTFVTEMNHLNQFLKSNEPGTKYCCLGFTFFCCTLGLSMLPFAYQLSHFENSIRKYLDELNKKYASVHVSWQLIPSTTPSDETYIIVSLEKEIDSKDLIKLEIS